jgi:hypothetical protein
MRNVLYSIIILIPCIYFINNLFTEDKTRPNVTFIVGDDAEQENKYFAAAKKYYRTHEANTQSIVVDSCRSLIEIQAFLQTHPTQGNKAWGRINIVAHGNEWTGLKLAIVPNGKGRVNMTTLKTALDGDILPKLQSCPKIDRRTQLHIQGCGVGKDEPLLKMIRRAFGGRLRVYSPEKFVTYQSDNQCYMADYYYSFQNPDSSFNKENAVQQLQKRYPSVKVDWATTFEGNDPINVQSPYVYRFKIPIHWTVNFKDSTEMPQFPQQNTRLFEHWLFQQKQLMATLDKTNLPKEAFRWEYETEAATIRIHGVCQVNCVLQPSEMAIL